MHVRGYLENGTTTTPFDMTVRNKIDRFDLVMDVIDRVPQFGHRAAYLRQDMQERLIQQWQYACEHGEDRPEIQNWVWPY